MAFQVVPDTASFRIIMSVFSGAAEFVNTIYVRDEIVAWSDAHLAATAVALGDAWRDEMMPLLASVATFDRVEARDEGTEFGNEQTAEYNTVGGVAGTPLSGALCMYGKLDGDSGNPPRDGGLFISPFSEAHIAGDVWDATHAGLVQTALQDIDAAVPSGEAWVIVSRYSKSENPVFPHKREEAVTNTISSIEVTQRLAIQRDRRVGHGS